jgi:hypothetical protein
MKKSLLFACFLITLSTVAQAQKLAGLDKSPMDMAYYPVDFAHDRKFAPEKVGDKAFARVSYSRPAKKDREVFGKLIPFGKVWRAGANEATEIKFYQDVVIQGKKLSAGVYSVYAIPNEKEWTIIFNSDLDQWGAYNYDAAKDVVRVNVPALKTEAIVENFTIQFAKKADNAVVMQLTWDRTLVELPLSF